MGTHHHHDHHDDHGHSHGHGHGIMTSEQIGQQGRAFAVGIGLNVIFVAIEAVYGLWCGSMALLADAGHNLSDVLGLVIAWTAFGLGRRKPTERFTYGLKGASILAALFNALFLLMACGAIALAAFQRFADPQPVGGVPMMVVATIGILINGATALLFARGRHGDINIRGAFLHMAADAAVSAGVVLAGLAILLTGWNWVDPAMSLIIVGLIVAGTWGLFRDALSLSLNAVPPGVDVAAVRKGLGELPGVEDVHHLHIWATSTTEVALTAHLRASDGIDHDALLRSAIEISQTVFGISHSTFQVEKLGCVEEGDSPACTAIR